MPTYDYECGSCGHTFEQFQSIKAASLKKCPQCGRNTLKRLIGAGAGLIFKGSGFYITDYRSDSYKKAAKADSESSGGTKSDSTAKTDTSSGGKSSDTTSSAKPATKPAGGNGTAK